MFFLRRKSRTATRPRLTFVSVPSQRSVVSQTVPRTVAELLRPRVRKRPRALERNRRIVRRDSCAADAERPLPRARQRRKLEPFRRSSVSPLALRRRDWTAWNSPREKLPDCVFPAVFTAAVSRTVPRRVFRNDPTGTSVASSRGMKGPPIRLAIETVPLTTRATNSRPSTAVGGLSGGGGGGGGGGTKNSNAPMSQPAPDGLATPRASVAGHAAASPVSIAGLPG